MNINDIDTTQIQAPSSEIWEAISRCQQELMEKYRGIEGMSVGPMQFQTKEAQTWIKNFLWRTHEELCEAGEAIEQAKALLHATLGDANADLTLIRLKLAHVFEEISDAIHFVCEASLLCENTRLHHGLIKSSREELEKTKQKLLHEEPSAAAGFNGLFLIPKLMEEPQIQISSNCKTLASCGLVFISLLLYQASYKLGLVGNVLKNKQWKQSEVISDDLLFKVRLTDAVKAILVPLMLIGMTDQDIFILYRQKNLVNKWRQDTNY
ncbi:MAG: hypothetical protein UY48_C0027G0002 [Candidatus Gottesmanbacteria bacterium GW2011_GWB1_49_7]|uniref:Uncharacterized protein n=1 Tax=Candidatus Gottesmanbacteria bacterium GW2011_GWB1_49_7 TaxID=1618448 RepID=A0A0G1VXD3_9BACT|nr:MAG: hypothetical protein UY48_C0027G0002 [Candidatus Gottesmanbacteria bacterium GW2011_GWB1_49_7]